MVVTQEVFVYRSVQLAYSSSPVISYDYPGNHSDGFYEGISRSAAPLTTSGEKTQPGKIQTSAILSR